LWFYAVLRTELRRDGNAVATAASVAFGAGVVSASLQLMLQAVQAASVLAAHPQMDASAARFFSGMMWSISVIAYVPVAVMLAAVAIASWQHTIFPAWLTWWSAAASLAHLIMSAGLVAGSGPLVPGGTLTYALYAMLLIWLIAITTVMARRPASVPVL